MHEKKGRRVLLVGPPGSGKTRKIIALFNEARKEGLEDRCLLILPDAGAREHMREILAREAPPDVPQAFSDRGIHTIQTLAGMKETRARAGKMHLGALIRKWVESNRLTTEGLSVLATSGGRAALAEAVLLLREYGHDFSSLQRQSTVVREESPVLLEVMRLWEEWLDEAGKADELEVFRKATQEAASSEWELVLIDGFTEMAPPQWDLVAAVVKRSVEVWVAIDPDQPPADKLAGKFVELGFETVKSSSAETARWGKGTLLGEFAGIASWRAHDPLPDYPTAIQPENLVFIEAADPRTEASAITREVAKCVADGRALSDIVVMTPHLGEFRKTLESEFRRARIPIRFYIDQPLNETSPGVFACGLLRLAAGDWSDRSVCAFLGHPSANVPDAEMQEIARHVSEWERLGDRDKWLNWLSGHDGWDSYILVSQIREVLKPDKADPIDFMKSLIEILEGRLRKAWRGLEEWVLADEAWAWKPVRSLLMECARVAAEIYGQVAPSDLAVIALEEFKTAKARPLDRRRDCVSAVSLLGARTWSAPVAIVAGLSREFFPKRPFPQPFLPDNLCRRLEPPLPTIDERRERETALFRIAVTRASEKLVLTRPVADSSGSPLLQSWPLARLRSWLGPIAVERTRTVSHQVPVRAGDAVFDSDAACLAAQCLAEDRERAGAILARCGVDMLCAVGNAQYESPALRRSDSLVEGVCGSPEHPASASQLNSLAQCRFLFYASRLLRLSEPLRERLRDGLDHAVWGRIAHEAIADWHCRGRPDDVKPIVLDAAMRLLEGIPWDSTIEGGLAQIVSAVERLRRFEESHIRPLGFEPADVELRIGTGGPGACGPVELKLAGGRSLWLCGIIDRVDRDSSGGVLIIDYKRSTRQVEGVKKGTKEGSDFQLACYAALARDGLGLDVKLAMFIPLKKLKVDYAACVLCDSSYADRAADMGYKTPGEPRSAGEHIAEALRAIENLLKGLERGSIKPYPRDIDKCGKECVFSDLCRYRFTGEEGGDEGGGEP